MAIDTEPKFELLTDGTFAGTITYTPQAGWLPTLTGSTVSVKGQDYCGDVHELTASLDGTGLIISFSASAALTKTWAHGPASMDIVATWPGESPKFRSWRLYFTVYNPIPDA